jgi:hypothetical protein
MDLKDNSVIPVTDDQVNAFAVWVNDYYGGKEEFQLALHNKNRATIAYYFTTTIFSEEMASAFNKSEQYINVISDKPDILLLQLYRRRLDIKISRTSIELVRRAFPNGKVNECVSDSLKLQRHTVLLRMEHYWQFLGRIPRYAILHQPTETEIAAYVPSVCAICLSTHAMLDTCVTNCGHEFGAKCFREWDFKTCPTCSELCNEVTEFVA